MDLMEDLFSFKPLAAKPPPSTLEAITLPGADVAYMRSFDLGVPPEEILRGLIDETPWRQEDVKVYGKTYRQPRLVAWYCDPGKSYKYSGIALEPLPWAGRIAEIKRRVEAAVDYRFNSVLLNYYRDQNDSMGLHSDDEKELGPRPVIASVSVGAERAFIFKSKLDKEVKQIKFLLASGSLLLMKGDTQKNYKHGIGKETRPLGPRVNLTFRIILD
jgi:alkylated DNA repair dioxygenase AlkB